MATKLWNTCQRLVWRSTYAYQPIKPDEIRILKLKKGSGSSPIECTLETGKLDSNQDYEALSWTWGPSSQSIHSIIIDDHRFYVRRYLFDALLALRSASEDRRLWVDAISINQLDNEEKSIIIPSMGRIYKLAKSVVIWLGNEADDSGYLMDCIRKDNKEEILSARFFEAWKCFTVRSWFGRTWIVQEFALSQKDPLIFCGQGGPIRWRRFYEVLHIIQDSVRSNPAIPLEGKSKRMGPDGKETWRRNLATIKHGMTAFHTLYSHERTRRLLQSSTGLDLRNALRTVAKLCCTVPKDRVYGMLGLLKPESYSAFLAQHQVDYGKPTAEVYHDAAAYLFVEGVDESVFTDFQSISLSEPNRPSWVFNLNTLHPNTVPLWVRDRQVMVADAVSPDKRVMSTRGIMLDQVEAMVAFDPPATNNDHRLQVRMYPYYMLSLTFFTLARLISGIEMPLWMIRVLTHKSYSFRDFTSLLYQFDLLTSNSPARAEAAEPLWRVLDTAERVTIPTDGPLEVDVWYHNLVAAGAKPSLFAGFNNGHLMNNDLSTTLQSALPGRTCFVGTDGWYGVVQGSPCNGDKLALLFPDVFMPFILRPVGDQYKLVGIAHISPSLREKALREFIGELELVEVI